MFPPIPSWDAMHPLIIHFPIALLTIVPVLLVLGLFWHKYSRGLFLASLVLMVVGTIGIYAAMATGEAGEERAEKIAGAEVVLHQHEELAETTRNIFTALTLIFGAMLITPEVIKRRARKNTNALTTNDEAALSDKGLFFLGGKTATIITAAFLLFYLAGVVTLANAAHQGGRLVHELGVQAAMNKGDGVAQAGAEKTAPANRKKDDDDDD